MAFTIDVFRNMLRINKHRLDDDLEIHAETQERISATLAKMNSRMLELKKSLEQTEAVVIGEVKERDPKLSNPLAEKEAKRDRSYISAWQAYQTARQEHEEWQGLYSAWQARGYNLKTLSDLHGAQYFAVSSTGRANAEEDVARARTRMREAAAEHTHRAPAVQTTTTPADPPPRRRTPL